MARCRAGDAAAWSELYEEHFDFAWRIARRLGTPESEVEDVVQDSLLAAYRCLGGFHGGSFASWLYRIIANRVAKRLRAARTREFFVSLLSTGVETNGSVEAVVEARSTLDRVSALLTELSKEKRETLALYELEGLSYEEIAHLGNTPIGTVRTRLHHARREFRALCEQNGLEP